MSTFHLLVFLPELSLIWGKMVCNCPRPAVSLDSGRICIPYGQTGRVGQTKQVKHMFLFIISSSIQTIARATFFKYPIVCLGMCAHAPNVATNVQHVYGLQ